MLNVLLLRRVSTITLLLLRIAAIALLLLLLRVSLGRRILSHKLVEETSFGLTTSRYLLSGIGSLVSVRALGTVSGGTTGGGTSSSASIVTIGSAATGWTALSAGLFLGL